MLRGRPRWGCIHTAGVKRLVENQRLAAKELQEELQTMLLTVNTGFQASSTHTWGVFTDADFFSMRFGLLVYLLTD